MNLHLSTIEWTAAAFGVLGTVLLALRGPRAGWGFVAYLASNLAWLAYAWSVRDWAILAQNLAFLASSVLGIWLWLVKPRIPVFRNVYRTGRRYRGRWAAARLALRCSR